jgi:N-sulphoglucosamine sulphohydrolase, C-terminal
MGYIVQLVSQKTIIMVLSEKSFDSTFITESPLINNYNYSRSNYSLAGIESIANLISLYSSSLPSHHHVRNSTDKPNFHIGSIFSRNSLEIGLYYIGGSNLFKLSTDFGFFTFNSMDDYLQEIKTRHNPDNKLIIFHVKELNQDIISSLFQKIEANFDLSNNLILMGALSPNSSEKVLPKCLTCSQILCPLTILTPKSTKNSFVSPEIVSIIDLFPTIFRFFGLKIPYSYTGKSFHELWEGKSTISEIYHRKSSLFEYKDGSKSLLTLNHHLYLPLNSSEGKIYDLKTDPKEVNNLWSDPESKEIKEKLLLMFLWAQLDKECMPMPRIAGA